MRITNVRKAAVIDALSGRFQKNGSRVLSKSISKLCNLSVKLGSFPDSCKFANLKPLFKTSNYRPIPVQPLVSKIIEKVVFYLTLKFYTTINQDFEKTTRNTHA